MTALVAIKTAYDAWRGNEPTSPTDHLLFGAGYLAGRRDGENVLRDRIAEFAEHHGSIRAAARVLQVDHAYLWRLAKGEKDNPDDALLRKLGLCRIVTYAPCQDPPYDLASCKP